MLHYLIKEASFSLRIRPCIEDKLGNSASQEQVSDIDVTTSPKGKGDRAPQNDREQRPNRKCSRKRGLPSKVYFTMLTRDVFKWAALISASSWSASSVNCCSSELYTLLTLLIDCNLLQSNAVAKCSYFFSFFALEYISAWIKYDS